MLIASESLLTGTFYLFVINSVPSPASCYLHFPELHISGIICCIPVLSLSTILLRIIHGILCINGSSLCVSCVDSTG